MAARGYSTLNRIQRHLGVTFTADQVSQATTLLEAAEAWIDQRARKAWLTGVLTEQHYVPGPNVYLRATPIASVTSVTARAGLADPGAVLVAGIGYEVRDLTTGWLYLPGLDGYTRGDVVTGYSGPYGAAYDRVTVAYTPNTGLPADIGHAATLLVGHWMQPGMSGVMPGIQSYSVGQELQVTFQDAAAGGGGVPADIAAIVDQYRRLVFA